MCLRFPSPSTKVSPKDLLSVDSHFLPLAPQLLGQVLFRAALRFRGCFDKQVPGFFSHGPNHSCGVAILVHKSFDFKLISSCADNGGRYLILGTIIQDTPFLLINTYAPSKPSNQSSFFLSLSELTPVEALRESNCKFVIGGDFNVALQPSLDRSGGNTTLLESVKFL